MGHVPRIYRPHGVRPGPLTLEGEQAKHLLTVLRLREGDEFLVFAGDGREWRATVAGSGRNALHAVVHELARQEAAHALSVEVWCGLVRATRLEWAIEKCVEAGADLVRPMVSAFASRGEGSAGKQERWERIAIEAAEQCGRLFMAVVTRSATLDELLARHHGTLIVADGSGQDWSKVASLVPPRGTVAVVVGPEGGLAPEEIARLRAAGGLLLRLGPNTLRTETAAVVATALLRGAGTQ